jgi:hypothetical protein
VEKCFWVYFKLKNLPRAAELSATSPLRRDHLSALSSHLAAMPWADARTVATCGIMPRFQPGLSKSAATSFSWSPRAELQHHRPPLLKRHLSRAGSPSQRWCPAGTSRPPGLASSLESGSHAKPLSASHRHSHPVAIVVPESSLVRVCCCYRSPDAVPSTVVGEVPSCRHVQPSSLPGSRLESRRSSPPRDVADPAPRCQWARRPGGSHHGCTSPRVPLAPRSARRHRATGP